MSKANLSYPAEVKLKVHTWKQVSLLNNITKCTYTNLLPQHLHPIGRHHHVKDISMAVFTLSDASKKADDLESHSRLQHTPSLTHELTSTRLMVAKFWSQKTGTHSWPHPFWPCPLIIMVDTSERNVYISKIKCLDWWLCCWSKSNEQCGS